MPRKFTRDEYEEYTNQPAWMLDDEDWTSEDEYHAYWGRTILGWQKQYKEKFGNILTQWGNAVSYVEHLPSKSFDIFVPETQVAQERIPYAIAALRQQVSLLYSNYPQPMFISPSMQYDSYAQALNAMLKIELKQNNFNSKMFDIGIDACIGSFGCLKVYVDKDQVGPFGKEGKIVIQRMDPTKISFDPLAKTLNWSDLGFIMYEDSLDFGTARKMYKGSEYKIQEALKTQQMPNKDGLYGDNLQSPVPNPIEGNNTLRNKIQIIECWFKDDRLKFVADMTIVDNSPTIVDDNGFPKRNPDYDEEKPDVYSAPAVDEDGYVIGEWKPAYPDGRCIVLAAGQTVVQDFANPYWHNRAPFVFVRGNPSRALVTTGDLTNIAILDKKINDVMSRIHVMCQNEIERPMLADNRTFRPPRAVYRLSGQATNVLVVQQGSTFLRMPPTEIPQFIWPYLQKLQKDLDTATAVAGVMRGDLTEGSQLSAEAVSSLQGMATSMLKMKAELIAEGMKELGYQLMWLQRETYDEGIKIQVADPDGKTQEIAWNEDNAASDYIVDIESGTGLPGAQAQESQSAIQQWREGLIDRLAALQQLRRPDAEVIVNRMKQDELEKIEAAAAGRAEGLQIKELLKTTNPSGSAGRKEKS